MKLIINKELCILAGECYYNHPEILQMGDDGTPVILVEELTTEEQIKHAREAAEVCPAGAISLEE